MNIYMICTLWTPFQAERDWKNSYREILLIPLYIFYSLCILFIYLSPHYEPTFHAKNIIWVYNKFTINYAVFKFKYNWRHCSAISLTVVMLCVCTKRVCVCNNELVCKAVWLAFSCQTSAISLPFILIPWARCTSS